MSPGADSPMPAALAALQAYFGYPEFRAGQATAVNAILAGRDTLVVLPTGGGKSLCYQVPAVVFDGLTVVLSPLISLMKDQVDALVARGIAATYLNSTLPQAEQSARMARVQRGEIKLLYVAPERFDAGTMADRLRAVGVRLLAVDEAHCISEWGHDFRPSYLRVHQLRTRLGNPPTMALTATATPPVRADIMRQLALRDPVVVITGFDRTNLDYSVLPCRNEADKDARLVELLRQPRDGVTIVYASTRRAVERVAGVLTRARIPALAYHAGLEDADRMGVQDAFMQERTRVIAATNAFGMGIDKPNVRLVVHHAMPGTLEAYYQEAGRAGRDRQPATAILLHAFKDRFTHEFFIKGTLPDRETVTAVWNACRKLADGAGLVSAASAAIAALSKVGPREVASGLRILERAGLLAAADASRTVAEVRLLATPERLTRELGGDVANHGMELALLRSLWRRARGNAGGLQAGIVADLDALPPGLGGARGAMRLLDALQARQVVVWRRLGEGLTLRDPAQALDDRALDWAAIDRRRAGELRKLDAMQGYAYTTQCRRAFVLRYFGDRAAAPTCTGCDNCQAAARAAKPKRISCLRAGTRQSRRA